MSYVLVVLMYVSYGSMASTSQQVFFATKELCEKARSKIDNFASGYQARAYTSECVRVK